MKNLKRIMAVVLTVVMLSTVSYAAGLSSSDMVNYKAFINAATITQGTTEFTVNVGMKNITGATIDIPVNANPGYFSTAISDEAVAAGIKATNITSDIVSITDAVFEDTLFYCNINVDKADLVLDENTPLLSVTFTIPEDVDLGTYNLSCVDGDYDGLALFGATSADATGVLWWEDAPFVTVKAAEEEKDESVTAGTSAAGATKITYGKDYTGSKALDGKYLVKADLGAAILDKDTTFTVTYDNTTKPFGASMWEDLGIEIDGTLAANKIIVAVAFDFDVNPADVTIAIAE